MCDEPAELVPRKSQVNFPKDQGSGIVFATTLKFPYLWFICSTATLKKGLLYTRQIPSRGF